MRLTVQTLWRENPEQGGDTLSQIALLHRIATAPALLSLGGDSCRVQQLSLAPSPFLMLTMRPDESPVVVLSRDYEFAASHRLALDGHSDAENLAIFGKCSNPNGHGHNYRLRVAVDPGQGPEALSVDLDGLVESAVLQHLDHKHLNLDTPYFQDRLPSVENIALTIHGLMAEALHASPLKFVGVRVWETDRTSASTSDRV